MMTTSNALMSYILVLPRIIRHALVGLALATLCALSGCSGLQLVYNQSDELIYWWLDGYADLRDGQKPFTREALAALQRWHRETQLPDYVALLQRTQALATQDITPAQVCAVADDMKTSVVTLLRFVEPTSTQLAAQLKPEQLRSIRQHFEKTHQEWRADWLDPEPSERLRYRTKQAINRLEDMYGRLDKAQKEVLRQWLSESIFDPVLSDAERVRRQADSLQTFQRIAQDGTGNAAAQSWMRELMQRSLDSPDPRYRAYSQALWKENCESFAKLHNSTTPTQRQHLLKTLRGYEADFKILMAQQR